MVGRSLGRPAVTDLIGASNAPGFTQLIGCGRARLCVVKRPHSQSKKTDTLMVVAHVLAMAIVKRFIIRRIIPAVQSQPETGS